MKTFLLSLIALFALTTSSHAYLDPGIGSMLIQGLIALVAAGTAYATFYWKKFKDFINKIYSSKKNKEKKIEFCKIFSRL